MKTSKLLITSLLAAAALSATAYATDYTVEGQIKENNSKLATNGGTIGGETNTEGVAVNAGDNFTFNAAKGHLPGYNNGAFAGNIILGTNATSENAYALYIHQGSSNSQTFNGTVSGSGNFGFGADSAVNQCKYIFTGDLTGLQGNIDANNFTTGGLCFGVNGTASAYSSAATAVDNVIANITGTGAISTTGSIVYNYTGGANGETLSVNNTSLTAKTLTFGGGATYTVVSTVSGKSTTASDNTLTISAGTTTFTGAVSNFGNVTVASGATLAVGAAGSLNLSGATVTLGSAIQNSGTVTISDTTVFNLTQTGATTLIDGGTIAGVDWSSLTKSNFTYNGAALARSTVNVSTAGAVTLDYVIANLTWAGTSSSTTWNVGSAQNWTNASTSAADMFYDYDSVTFDASTTGTTTNIAAGVTVTDLTISGGTHRFTVSSEAYVKIAGTASVENGATLVLDTKTGGKGLLRGAITVKSGGELQFTKGDLTGFDAARIP